MRLFQAIGMFFKVLFNRAFAAKVASIDTLESKVEKLEQQLESETSRLKLEAEKLKAAPKEDHSNLEEGACALLSLMQKEARFIDFVKENLEGIDDARVGSISRLIHKDLSKVFDQYVKIEAILDQKEGEKIQLEEGFDMGLLQLSGNVDAKLPFEGTLRHKGWIAQKLNLPKRPKDERNRVLVASEVEVA